MARNNVNTFTDESIRRIAYAVFAEERDALRSLFGFPPVQPDRPKWVQFRNTSGEEIPAYGVMRVTGAELKAGLPIITVAKPSTTFQRLYLVNGPQRVGSGSTARGIGTWLDDEPGYVLYESGTPAYGESWGPKASQWSLAKWRYGFTVVGGLAGTGSGIRVVAKQREVDVVYGQTNGTHTKGSSSTIDLYDGNNSAISSTSITATNRFATVATATAKKVMCTWIGGTWISSAAEC